MASPSTYSQQPGTTKSTHLKHTQQKPTTTKRGGKNTTHPQPSLSCSPNPQLPIYCPHWSHTPQAGPNHWLSPDLLISPSCSCPSSLGAPGAALFSSLSCYPAWATLTPPAPLSLLHRHLSIFHLLHALRCTLPTLALLRWTFWGYPYTAWAGAARRTQQDPTVFPSPSDFSQG